MSNDKFWTEDINVLFSKNNYLAFFPNKKMSKNEQLNALTRFSIYSFIILLLFSSNYEWLYVPILILIIAIIMNYIEKQNFTEHMSVDNLTNIQNNTIEYDHTLENENQNNTIEMTEENKYDNIQENTVNKCRKPTKNNPFMNVPVRDFVKGEDNIPACEQTEEIKKYNNIQENTVDKCRKPTKDNPFMNVPVHDFVKGEDDIPACEQTEEIKREINDNFYKDLYRNQDDLFEKKNSERQFFTMPSTTTPNDQIAFAKWCYSTPDTCKETGLTCLKNVDMRYN